VKKKQTRVERAAEKYGAPYANILGQATIENAFLAGSAWQRREDVRAVRAKIEPSYARKMDNRYYAIWNLALECAIAAIKRSGKGK
jgi:hypothetical protein